MIIRLTSCWKAHFNTYGLRLHQFFYFIYIYSPLKKIHVYSPLNENTYIAQGYTYFCIRILLLGSRMHHRSVGFTSWLHSFNFLFWTAGYILITDLLVSRMHHRMNVLDSCLGYILITDLLVSRMYHRMNVLDSCAAYILINAFVALFFLFNW